MKLDKMEKSVLDKELKTLHFKFGTWKQVADFIGVAESTVYRWRKEGKVSGEIYDELIKPNIIKKKKVRLIIYGIART